MPKISALPPLTTPDAADEVAIVDTSAGTTKKILISDLGNNGEWLSDGAVERGGLTAAALVSDATGHGFLEIARTTLGSEGDTITVSSIPARKYLRVLIYALATGGTVNVLVTFNGDTGANYGRRRSVNGAADATANTQTSADLSDAVSTLTITEALIVNVATATKLITSHTVASAGANAPDKRDNAHSWNNTSNQISSITLTNTGTGNYAIGSEIVVLGMD